MSSQGGPIARLEHAESQVAGTQCTHATTYFREGLLPESQTSQTVTEQPDGAGTHRSNLIACHMAISEAIERWALCASIDGANSEDFGLEFDSSSNGFAAFPGLFKRQARKAAFRESIERHCLICWWEGLLPHYPLADPSPGIRAIRIRNPFSQHTVVVIWAQHGDHHSYAFGAGENINNAIWRALVELDRIQSLLDQLIAHIENPKENTPITDLYERRILFFSRDRGKRLFLDRMLREVKSSPQSISLLFDGQVKGPWDKYASVWRTIIEAPNKEYLSDREDYFFW
ncbi:MAG: hypothetical protein AAF546_10045 [Verrucomicrobiota bacterium]